MTLPTGTITMDQVRIELGIAQAGVNLNLASIRTLASVGGSGTSISMSQLRGKSAYTPMTVSGNDDAITDYSTGTAYTHYLYPSVNVSGGSGGYTFAWSFIAQNGASIIGSTTSQSINVGHSVSKFGYTGSCTLQCVITDNTAHSVTVPNITCTWNISDTPVYN